MCSKSPPYKHPETGKVLDDQSLAELFKGPLEKSFAAFFPTLNEQNWEQVLSQKMWSLSDLPYLLKLENMTSYYEKCHYCAKDNCRNNCPVPFDSNLTVLDLLHKLGSEDNVSYFDSGKGKKDVVLNVVFNN